MAKFSKPQAKKSPASQPVPPSSIPPGHSPESFNLIHYLLNHIGDELMLIDCQARIVFVNNATVRGLGVPREVLLRKRVIDFMQKKMTVAAWRKEFFNRIRKSKDSISYRLERIAGNGQKQTIDATVAYMPYKSEEYVLSVARDVTQELAMKVRVKESEDLYRLISDGAGDGIFACDLKGNLTYVNPALESLVGVPAAQLKGRRFIDYIAKDSFEKALNCFKQSKEGANNIREEIELVNKRGYSVPVEINVSPLFQNNKIVSIHAVVRDIRHRRHLETILRQSEKMQAIQLFVAGMAKEIKDPLFAVIALTKKLTERYRNRDFEYIGYTEFKEMMKALEQIHARAKYSYETTQRLLELSKKKIGLKKDYCHPNEVIMGSLRLRQSQFKANNIRIKFSLSRHIPCAAIGRIELGQVLDNVTTNAIQAMPGGGLLTIRSLFQKTMGCIQIDVHDSGVGISSDDLPHIFEPFFTTRQRGMEKSTGLGLPIVYELLKASQGEINVQSSLRNGTVVTIRIPVVKGKARR